MTVSDTTAAAAATVAPPIPPVNRFRIFQGSFPPGDQLRSSDEPPRIGRFYQKAVRAVNEPGRRRTHESRAPKILQNAPASKDVRRLHPTLTTNRPRAL